MCRKQLLISSSSESTWTSIESGIVSLALHQHVHVWLTEWYVISTLLEAWNEVGIETTARVLLLLNLLLLRLSILLLRLSLFLLLNLLSTVWSTASHHSSDSLMSDFRTSTESHTSHDCWADSWHHATTLGGCLHGRCVLNGWAGGNWGTSLGWTRSSKAAWSSTAWWTSSS